MATTFEKLISLVAYDNALTEPTRPLYISYAVFCLKKNADAVL